MTLDEQIAFCKRSIAQIEEWQREQNDVPNNYETALAFERSRLAELEAFRAHMLREEEIIARNLRETLDGDE